MAAHDGTVDSGSRRPSGLRERGWSSAPGWRLPVLAVLAIALVTGPLFLSSYWVGLLTQVVILAILAMSLDVLLGYTGLPSLGHAAFFGVAAYAVAVLSTAYRADFWMCVLAGAVRGNRARRDVRLDRFARARRVLPDDHPGAGHGAVGTELSLDSGDRRRQRHLRHPAICWRTPACRWTGPVAFYYVALVVLLVVRRLDGAAGAVAVRAVAARDPRERSIE